MCCLWREQERKLNSLSNPPGSYCISSIDTNPVQQSWKGIASIWMIPHTGLDSAKAHYHHHTLQLWLNAMTPHWDTAEKAPLRKGKLWSQAGLRWLEKIQVEGTWHLQRCFFLFGRIRDFHRLNKMLCFLQKSTTCVWWDMMPDHSL